MAFRWSAGTAMVKRDELAESEIQEERRKMESIEYIGELRDSAEATCKLSSNCCFVIRYQIIRSRSRSTNIMSYSFNSHQWESI